MAMYTWCGVLLPAVMPESQVREWRSRWLLWTDVFELPPPPLFPVFVAMKMDVFPPGLRELWLERCREGVESAFGKARAALGEHALPFHERASALAPAALDDLQSLHVLELALTWVRDAQGPLAAGILGQAAMDVARTSGHGRAVPLIRDIVVWHFLKLGHDRTLFLRVVAHFARDGEGPDAQSQYLNAVSKCFDEIGILAKGPQQMFRSTRHRPGLGRIRQREGL